MRIRARHALLCGVIAAAVAGGATVAQGKTYPIIFDPQFDGTVVVDMPNYLTCFANHPSGPLGLTVLAGAGGDPACTLNLLPLSADVFPVPAGVPHYFDAAGFTDYTDIASSVFLQNNDFKQLATRALQIILVQDPMCVPGLCAAAQLEFGIGNAVGENPHFPGLATLTPGAVDNDGVFHPDLQTVLQSDYGVPEPGTLGLLLGAFGVGWLAKRRKIAS